MNFIINLILWLIMLYGIVVVIWNLIYKKMSPDEQRGKVKLPFKPIYLFIVIGVIVLKSIITIVPGQEVYVVQTPWGINDKPLHSGWSIIPPWNKTFPMDKTVWVYTFSDKKWEGQVKEADAIWAPTRDGIKIGIDVSINWRIDPEQAPYIYQNVSEADGTDEGRYKWIEANLIRAKTVSVISLIVGRYSPIEVYGGEKRQEIQDKVYEMLKDELAVYRLILDNVNIREVNYFPDYDNAIKQKKLAEQQVLTLEQVTRQKEEQVKQAELDKQMTITKAEAEAKSLQIQGQSISDNPKVIALKWIEKWNGDVPKIMGGSSNFLMDISKYF